MITHFLKCPYNVCTLYWPRYVFQWCTFWANNSHFVIIGRFIDGKEVSRFLLIYYKFPIAACSIWEIYIENLSECFRKFLEFAILCIIWKYLCAQWFHEVIGALNWMKNWTDWSISIEMNVSKFCRCTEMNGASALMLVSC